MSQTFAPSVAEKSSDIDDYLSSLSSGIRTEESHAFATEVGLPDHESRPLLFNNCVTPELFGTGKHHPGRASKPRYGTADSGIEEPSVTPTMGRPETYVPPDGGCRAWTILFCSFLCNGIVFGIINSSSQIFEALIDMYQQRNDPDAATKASLVGALQIGATFALSPVSGILADKFGIRRTAVFGGFVATLGVFLSSFCIENLQALCFTYGIMYGGGASLVYTPSLAIIGHYFKKRMGIANGIVAAGSSTFSMILPHVLKEVLKEVGIAHSLRLLTVLVSTLMVASLSFKPQLPPKQPDSCQADNSLDLSDDNGGRSKRRSKCYRLASKVVYFPNWKNIKYVIWTMAVPTALFGYFVPYVHLTKYVKDILPEENGVILITCLSSTSFLGRLMFGRIADHPRANGVMLQQMALAVMGCCTMLLVGAQYFGGFAFYALIIMTLLMGLFDGCFITMFGPIAYEICGPHGASQGIGFILGLNSVSLTIGPLVAGILYDHFGTYTLALLLAGVPPLVGAFFMCLIHRVGNNNPLAPVDTMHEEPRALSEEDVALRPSTANQQSIDTV